MNGRPARKVVSLLVEADTQEHADAMARWIVEMNYKVMNLLGEQMGADRSEARNRVGNARVTFVTQADAVKF